MKRNFGEKALSLLLVTVMCISLCTPAMAANVPGTAVPAEISVGNIEATVGGSFVVPVSIIKNPGITNFGLLVTYEKAALELTKVSAYASAEDEENMNNGGLCATGLLAGNEKTGIIPWVNLNAIRANKVMFYLYFTAKTVGTHSVGIGLNPITGVFQDGTDSNAVIDYAVNFTPGQITVKPAAVTGCTLNFISDTTVTKTVESGTVMAKAELPAEPVKAGYHFAGWYSEVGQPTVTAGYLVESGAFTGREFRPKYDTVTAAGDYHAVWVKNIFKALTIKDTAVTPISNMPGALTAASGTTFKLLVDSTTQITVVAGQNLTLDLNGHSVISASADYKIGDTAIINKGTLSIENSSVNEALLSATATGWWKNYLHGITNEGTIPMLRDVTVSSTGYNIDGGTITVMRDCVFRGAESYNISNVSGEKMLACSMITKKESSIYNGTITELADCTLEGAMTGISDSSITTLRNCTITAQYFCMRGTGVGSLENSTLTSQNGMVMGVASAKPVHIVSATLHPAAKKDPIMLEGGTLSFAPGNTLGAVQLDGSYPTVPGFTVFSTNEYAEPKGQVQFCYAGVTPLMPTYIPTRPSDDGFSYTFAHWADSSNQAVPDYSAITKDTTLHAVFTSTARPRVAKVGTTEYGTVSGALAAISTGTKTGIIEMLSDATMTEKIVIPADCTVTWDLNGFKMTSTWATDYLPLVSNEGTLTVKSTGGKGTIEALAANEGNVLENHRGMTVDNVKIIGGVCIYNKGVAATACIVTNCELNANGKADFPKSIQNYGGKIQKIENCVCTEAINNGDSGSIDLMKNVTIGTAAAKAQIGIENSYGCTIGSIEKCTVWARTHGILNQGVESARGKILDVVNSQFTSDGADYSGWSGVVGGAVTNSGWGEVHMTSGRFCGFVRGTPSGGKTVPITYPADSCLSGTPDAEGYYIIEKPSVMEPIITQGKATVTVPDQPLSADKKTSIVATSQSLDAMSTEMMLGAATVATIGTSPELAVVTNDAAISFNQAALGAIQISAASAAITLKVAVKTVADLLPQQQAAAEGATKIIDLKLVRQDNATDVTFAAGQATIAFDYKRKVADSALTVLHIADDGTKAEVAYTLIGNKLVFNTNSFSTYAVVEQLGQMEKYTMTVETAAQHYNPGDTIAANIRISTPVASQFGSFGFTLRYDSTKLELVSITTALEGGTADNTQNGKFTYTILGVKPNPVTSAGVVAATATFKVKAGITTGTDTITLTEPEVIYQGTNKGPMPVVAGKTVNLDNVKVGFAQGTGSTLAAATAYVKYDTAGLWTDNTYATKFAFPVPQAAAGYRLETSKLWGNGASTYTQGEVEVLKFTADTTLTVQTVKTQKVSFATSTGGTISPVDPQTIDKGASLFTLALPTPTPTPGYHFTGWYDGASMVDMANYVVNADITLTAKFGFESYIWTAPSLVGATMSIPTGVTEGKVTHNQPIAFTLTVDANYVVTAVSYTVGAGAATALTPVNGTYTIAGDKILGNIKVEVTAQKYHKVTFSAGIGNTLTTETAYVRDNTAGLFTDTSFGTAFTVPKPVAAETYRLAKDTAEDPLWKTGITGYTSSSINQAALTVDTVLTAQSIKTYVVTYVAGANGALTVKPLTLTVDTGYTLKAEDVPTLTPNSGYKFSAWTAADPVGQNITADTTYTANFAHGTYAITFSGGDSVNFAEQTGVTGGNTATHGTAITFKIVTSNGYKVTAVKSTIGSTTKILTADPNGVYTIFGNEIIDGISVTAESTETYTVSFKTSVNGVLENGDQDVVFSKNDVIAAGRIPGITPNLGYVFKEWQVNGVAQAPEGHTVTASITFTALFEQGKYAVTMPNAAIATVTAVSGLVADNATHDTDLVLTVVGASGKLVNKVSYQVGTGTVTPLTISANGQFTIPGSAITAPITISVDTLDGIITLVTKDAYKAVAAGKQMVVYTTAKIADQKYVLSNGTELFYSEKYAGYVCFAVDTETAVTLATKLSKQSGPAIEIRYTGDIQGTNPGVTGADAGIINDLLHSNARVETTTDMQRFQADVDFNKAVTTADITKTLNTSVGK